MKTQVSDGTGIYMTTYRFQFINDFHGPDTGATGNGSAGKGGFNQINRILIRLQFSFDHRYQVKHIVIRLQSSVFYHFYASATAYPAQVISHQVNNHGQFGIVFFAFQKVFTQFLIF